MFPDISPLHTLSVITLMTSSLLSLETITSQICNLFCTTQVSPLYLPMFGMDIFYEINKELCLLTSVTLEDINQVFSSPQSQ